MTRTTRALSLLVTTIIVFTSSALVAPPTAASGPTLTQGSLDKFSNVWNLRGSDPENLVAVGDTLYFTADSELGGEELYSYTDGQLTTYELLPGDAHAQLHSLFEYNGGIGLLVIESGNYSDSDLRVGFAKDGVVDWIQHEDLFDLDTSDTVAAGVGDRLFVADEDESSIEELTFDLDSDYVNTPLNAGFLYEDGQSVLPDNELDGVNRLDSIGDYLIGDIELDSSGGFEIYALDTREENPDWVRLAQDVGPGDYPDYMLVDGNELHIVFPYEIFKYEIDEAGDLVPAEIFGGNSRVTYANGIDQAAVSGSEVFFSDNSTGELVWLSGEGFVVAEESDGDVAWGATLFTGVAVIDGVLYFNQLDRVAAWEFEQDLLFPAVGISSPVAYYSDDPQQGIHAFGSNFGFVANTEKGRELVVVNTLDDSAEVVDIETYPDETWVIDAAEFDGTHYFFTTSPEDHHCYLMKQVGTSALLVRDSNQLPFRLPCWADYSGDFPNIIQEYAGDLYFLAHGNLSQNPLETGRDGGIRLWRLEAGENVPELLPWDGAPNLTNGASLRVSPIGLIITFNSWNASSIWLSSGGGIFQYSNSSNLNAYSFENQNHVLPFLDDGAYLITMDNDTASKDRKLVRLQAGGASLDPIETYRDASNNSTDLNESQQLAIKFHKILPTGDPDFYYALVSGYPGAATSSERAVVLLEYVADSGPEIELLAYAGVEADIRDMHFLAQGPSGDPHLLIRYETDNLDGRVAFVNINSGINFGAIELSRFHGYANVLKLGSTPLKASESVYLEEDGLIIVRGSTQQGGDYVYGHYVFESDDFTSGTPLAGISVVNRSDFGVGNDRAMLLWQGLNQKVGDTYYLTMNDRLGPPANQTYKYNPFADTARFNFSNPVITQIDDDGFFEAKVVPRPSGASHNAALDPNYLGGPARQVMRSAAAANLDGNAFTRSGYALSGWATSPNGSAVYQPNGSYPFTQSDILYAVWEQTVNTVTVEVPVAVPVAPGNSRITFSAPEGTTPPATIDIKSGELVRLPKVEKLGHNFVGWSESATGPVFIDAYRPANSVTLIPRFSPKEIKIFLAPEKGVDIPASVEYSFGEELVLPRPTKSGMTFVGWLNAETGNRITSDWVPNESVMLVAQFRVGEADEVINFWRNSKLVSNTQMRKLSALVADEALINGRRTIVIRGFDEKNKDLARGRALNVAIKLRKLGVTDAIVLETQLGGKENKAEILVN